jgi:hypothetical protein
MNKYSKEVLFFPDGRLDTLNACNYLGLSIKTMAMMRTYGTGPKFIKRGRVFYYKSDLDAWLNANGKAISTSQARLSKSTCTNINTEGNDHESF